MNDTMVHLQSAALDPTQNGEAAWRSWLPSVGLFLFIYIISYVDRQILSIVVGPLKASLGVSDFQVGLLQGFAFSLVLAVAAVLTAPLVDRGNRVRVISICMLIWCMMTIWCGFASNFVTLLVARTGLALAEAVVPMAVLSIICDIAPRTSVPRAAALFMAAPYCGSGIALLLGGPLLATLGRYEGVIVPLVGPFEPWRGLFFALGAPGLVLAVLLLVVLREPQRRDDFALHEQRESVVPFLRANTKFLAYLLPFTAMIVLVSYTIYAWMPTYMIRTHGIAPAAAGITVGSIFVISGIGGCIFGSWIMSRSTGDLALSHVVRTMTRLSLCFGPLLLLMPLAPNAFIALVMLAVGFFLMTSALSSVMTPLPLFAPAHLRGRVTAFAGLCNAAVGGLGPMIVGAITDFIFRTPDRISYALTITFSGAFLIMLVTGPHAAAIAARIDQERDGIGD